MVSWQTYPRFKWQKQAHIRGITFTACAGNPRVLCATCPGHPGNTGVLRPSSPPLCYWPDCWGSWVTALPVERPGHHRRSTRGPGGVTGQKKTNLWVPVKLLRQEKKFDFEKVPSHSGTAPAWICPCRWEPRGCRLGPGSGTGGGTGGSTFHWGTGWSPPRGAGRGAHTPPSGNPQGPVHQSLPAPLQILTGRVLKTLNPQQNT